MDRQISATTTTATILITNLNFLDFQLVAWPFPLIMTKTEIFLLPQRIEMVVSLFGKLTRLLSKTNLRTAMMMKTRRCPSSPPPFFPSLLPYPCLLLRCPLLSPLSSPLPLSTSPSLDITSYLCSRSAFTPLPHTHTHHCSGS